MTRWREPERLEGALRRELGRFGVATGIDELVAAWPEAVGEAIARNAWPARAGRDGTLHVATTDSIWAFELGQREAEIRASLGRLAPPRLRFAPGPLPDRRPAAAEERPRVPAPGPREREQAAELAAPIDDDELRALVARAIGASLARAASDRPF